MAAALEAAAAEKQMALAAAQAAAADKAEELQAATRDELAKLEAAVPSAPTNEAPDVAGPLRVNGASHAAPTSERERRRQQQMDKIAAQLHEELCRRGGSAAPSPGSSGALWSPGKGVGGSNTWSPASSAKSDLRGKLLDNHIKTLSRRFLLLRDMR
jgi:hypothetical protein